MTMDEAGDIANADVQVANGVIVAVGQNLKAPGVAAIDGQGMIVLPGLVETHWHMWNTLLRSMSGDKPDLGYFRSTAMLGQKFLADDMYQGTRLACAEAINNGITHVHDWCHNIRGPEYADADLKALRESGLRARFSYGAAQGMPNTKGIDLADLTRLHDDWAKLSPDGLLTLGLAWRGQGGNNAANAIPPEIYTAEIGAARKLGLPISVHASGSRPAIGQIDAIAKAGLLSKDMQLIHANKASADEIKAVADAGASISISPYTELRIGFGLPQTTKFLEAKIPVGLSVDTVELSGNADMFGIMKVTQNAENGIAETEFTLPARRVLALATSEGARSMGIADQHRLAESRQARRPDHGQHPRHQSRRVRRPGAYAGDRGRARQCRHGRGRRPHSQAQRQADRHERGHDRQGGRRRQRRLAQARQLVVNFPKQETPRNRRRRKEYQ